MTCTALSLGTRFTGCTFETLVARFGIGGSAVARIARIVHDVDLKDAQYNEPEAPALGQLVEGLRRMRVDDSELLQRGMSLFEALYLAFNARSLATDREMTQEARWVAVEFICASEPALRGGACRGACRQRLWRIEDDRRPSAGSHRPSRDGRRW